MYFLKKKLFFLLDIAQNQHAKQRTTDADLTQPGTTRDPTINCVIIGYLSDIYRMVCQNRTPAAQRRTRYIRKKNKIKNNFQPSYTLDCETE